MATIMTNSDNGAERQKLGESETKRTVFKQPEAQKERWKEAADEHDMNLSGFIRHRVEWENKPFPVALPGDDDGNADELRKQRDRLRADLRDANDRIERLENRLSVGGVKGMIRDFLRENGAARPDEVIEHVEENAPEQAGSVLDDMSDDGEIDGFFGPERAGNDIFLSLTDASSSEESE